VSFTALPEAEAGLPALHWVPSDQFPPELLSQLSANAKLDGRIASASVAQLVRRRMNLLRDFIFYPVK